MRILLSLLFNVFLQTHHFLKLHSLAAAHFYFFTPAHFQQQASIEVSIYPFYHPQVHNVFAVGAEKHPFVQPLFQCIEGFQDEGFIGFKKYTRA